MTNSADIIVVGSGNAALVAALAAQEAGASVLVIEKGDESLAGGNTRYTAGAMRFAYDSSDDLLPLLASPEDPRVSRADFGSYPVERFSKDLIGFNETDALTREQHILVTESLPTVQWLATLGLRFDPIWGRQSFERDGRRVFWGGLTLETSGEGDGLYQAELDLFLRAGGEVRYECEMAGLLAESQGDGTKVRGVRTTADEELRSNAVVLACGGFEANTTMRVEYLGPEWERARVRGTPLNLGDGLRVAYELGAVPHGHYEHCHATPMDLHMAENGNLDLPPIERKHYRKICYFLGVMLNADGERFVDEGKNFRNYTYAQFGRAILEQPGGFAWQIFDDKITDLLYGEYSFHDAHFVESDTLEGLIGQLEGVDQHRASETMEAYNNAVDDSISFEPSELDGKATRRISPPKSNWAQRIDTPPFRAYPVTGGITFTYGGLRVDDDGAVMRADGSSINGLHACGELVGGVFVNGYPGGSGLTSGAVFGRRAGSGAARLVEFDQP
ncbi:MAG: FAD-dependent tricarballylate dehydrogenase TcuA [Acidimicrobiales bacterium]|nr:FAD-dependent tricarballylate dehydrogenase TcuA [Acidimicrobiales bacterium]RZV47009.1 MAG: FAD-dependent oxidoreductase [Acidimicrobiales bacterium]